MCGQYRVHGLDVLLTNVWQYWINGEGLIHHGSKSNFEQRLTSEFS